MTPTFDNDAFRRDCQLASAGKRLFKVCTKAGKGAPWLTVSDQIEELPQAMALALVTQDFDVAVFVFHEGQGFYHYWSSRHPEVLNSTVMTRQFLT